MFVPLSLQYLSVHNYYCLFASGFQTHKSVKNKQVFKIKIITFIKVISFLTCLKKWISKNFILSFILKSVVSYIVREHFWNFVFEVRGTTRHYVDIVCIIKSEINYRSYCIAESVVFFFIKNPHMRICCLLINKADFSKQLVVSLRYFFLIKPIVGIHFDVSIGRGLFFRINHLALSKWQTHKL